MGLSSARGTLRMSERKCLQKTVVATDPLTLTCDHSFKLKTLRQIRLLRDNLPTFELTFKNRMGWRLP